VNAARRIPRAFRQERSEASIPGANAAGTEQARVSAFIPIPSETQPPEHSGAKMNGSAHEYDYDLVVIGGGSGGLAASKQAAKLGAKVACLDFVTPSPQGTRWGLGGTCVNVGCIPKKLMHQAAILGEQFSDAREFGWSVDGKPAVSWEKMVEAIQNHVGSLNWGYRVALRDKDVKYINARGVFTDPHTIVATKANGKSETITAAKFIIAVGGRPSYLGVPGDKECCITSDDIFSLPTTPGKTLVVGASYIALECAGFLTNLGFDTTVVSRSIFLRGFDQEIANMIAEYMERHGTRMLRKCTPVKFEKLESGKIAATIRNNDFGLETVEEFDTVLLAVGRTAITKDMGLDLAGVKFDPKTGKIPVVNEQTNVPHIYAIGDVLENRQVRYACLCCFVGCLSNEVDCAGTDTSGHSSREAPSPSFVRGRNYPNGLRFGAHHSLHTLGVCMQRNVRGACH